MFTLLFITQCSAASSSFGFSTISTSVTSMTSGAESASSFFFAFLSVLLACYHFLEDYSTCCLLVLYCLFLYLNLNLFIFLGSQNSNWQNSFSNTTNTNFTAMQTDDGTNNIKPKAHSVFILTARDLSVL